MTAVSPDLKIRYFVPHKLKPRPNNARTHSRKQIDQIAESISKLGFTNPVLIDGKKNIVAGHGRVAAASQLGLKRVPTVTLKGLTQSQLRAYVIADNRLAELAGWDPKLLALELQDLSELDLGFDLSVVGFELPEIDVLIEGLGREEEDDPADILPEISAGPPVSREGDLWLMGKHRLLCGDALDGGAYQYLLQGAKAQMVFIDPPYNVPVDGHVCGLGVNKHSEFAMASGEMSEAEFVLFLQSVFQHLIAHSINGSMHFVCMDWRHFYELQTAGRSTYTELKNLCVWNKTNGGMGSLYRSKHELIAVFKSGKKPHINNIELGRHGRNRTNVWDYAGINTFVSDRDEALSMHPTVKPVRLVADAILDCSRRGGVVLDSFCGSGTTILAAERTGRRAYVMEIDPRYVDVAIRRWQMISDKPVHHEQSGKTFEEISKIRHPQNLETTNA